MEGYPGFTTAEGQKALFSLTTGAANTAVGLSALITNAAGSFNTATGAGALLFSTADDNTVWRLLFHAALRFFEIAVVFERLDHVASSIINANHDGMRPAVRLCIPHCVGDRV